MPRLALIADDLTGALDSAVPFVAAGLSVAVATRAADLARVLASPADVVAVSLRSRAMDRAAAVTATRAAAALIDPALPLFRKIDSRLKGHVAAEIAALAACRGMARAVVCPAVPDLGRVVRDGAVQGAGVAVPIPVAAAATQPGGPAVSCPDAVSDADLDRIVAGAGGALLAGARGLAAALARRMARGAAAPPLPPLSLPLAIIAGSRDPVTLEQIAGLCRSIPDVVHIPAPDGTPTALRAGEVVLLQATGGGGALDGPTVAARLARAAAPLLAGRGTLVLTGGETAEAVLDAQGIGPLTLLGEVQPGLPLCRPADGTVPLIVTKSGGFGAPDSLIRLVRSAGETVP